jgi:hypothetical protein
MFEKSWQTSRGSQDPASDVTPRADWICLQADDWRTSHVRKSVTSARDLWLLYSVTIHNLVSPWQLYRLRAMMAYKEVDQ